MYICKTCKREFNTITQLASHLSHPKSKCKTIIKDYYDKYFKKENEGICQFCGRKTPFCGLVQGYPNNTCKHCRNLKPESKKKRSENFKIKKEIKKKNDGYYDLPIKCELCKDNIRFKTLRGLSYHIATIHKDTNIKEYYDKYFKKENEGICPITNHETIFMNLIKGYHKYYKKGTNSLDPLIQEKKKETLFKNFGVCNPIFANSEQRINNYKITRNKARLLKKTRIKFISILRILTIDKNNKLQCQICGKKYLSYIAIAIHLKIHNITSKDYYNKYFKKDNEGVCPISGLPTTYESLQRGYFKYHFTAVTSSPEIKNADKRVQLKYIKNKIKQNQKLFNVEFLDLESINTIGEKLDVKCLTCEYVFKTRYTNLEHGIGLCPLCNPSHFPFSKGEKEVSTYIKDILPSDVLIYENVRNIISNPKTNNSLELDIFIPSKNIAIEYNGIYWHSEQVQKDAKNIHLTKYNECLKKGIFLIQIFEDEWNRKKDIVKTILKYKLNCSDQKIYGRKCIIKEINTSEKNIFLDKNHIQGSDKSKIKLGLFYQDELVSVMTFCHGNISRGGNPNNKLLWELSRFASKQDISVIGGAGKLLSYFKNNYIWSQINTYADLRYSHGDLYYKIGFEKVGQTFPNYWYVVNDSYRVHRFALRKRPDEPKDIPEWKLRFEEGYYRIWDCGNLKFSLTKD